MNDRFGWVCKAFPMSRITFSAAARSAAEAVGLLRSQFVKLVIDSVAFCEWDLEGDGSYDATGGSSEVRARFGESGTSSVRQIISAT